MLLERTIGNVATVWTSFILRIYIDPSVLSHGN